MRVIGNIGCRGPKRAQFRTSRSWPMRRLRAAITGVRVSYNVESRTYNKTQYTRGTAAKRRGRKLASGKTAKLTGCGQFIFNYMCAGAWEVEGRQRDAGEESDRSFTIVGKREQRTESYGFRFAEGKAPWCRATAALSGFLKRLVKHTPLHYGYARIAGKLVTRSPRVPFIAAQIKRARRDRLFVSAWSHFSCECDHYSKIYKNETRDRLRRFLCFFFFL